MIGTITLRCRLNNPGRLITDPNQIKIGNMDNLIN